MFSFFFCVLVLSCLFSSASAESSLVSLSSRYSSQQYLVDGNKIQDLRASGNLISEHALTDGTYLVKVLKDNEDPSALNREVQPLDNSNPFNLAELQSINGTIQVAVDVLNEVLSCIKNPQSKSPVTITFHPDIKIIDGPFGIALKIALDTIINDILSKYKNGTIAIAGSKCNYNIEDLSLSKVEVRFEHLCDCSNAIVKLINEAIIVDIRDLLSKAFSIAIDFKPVSSSAQTVQQIRIN